MDIIKDIPAKTGVAHSVERITINLTEKIAYVEIHPLGGPHTVVPIPILDVFTKYSVTTQQKNIIKGFFRYVIADAVEVVESTITEEIFPPNP